jgi:hypothetical protein
VGPLTGLEVAKINLLLPRNNSYTVIYPVALSLYWLSYFTSTGIEVKIKVK